MNPPVGTGCREELVRQLPHGPYHAALVHDHRQKEEPAMCQRGKRLATIQTSIKASLSTSCLWNYLWHVKTHFRFLGYWKDHRIVKYQNSPFITSLRCRLLFLQLPIWNAPPRPEIAIDFGGAKSCQIQWQGHARTEGTQHGNDLIYISVEQATNPIHPEVRYNEVTFIISLMFYFLGWISQYQHNHIQSPFILTSGC